MRWVTDKKVSESNLEGRPEDEISSILETAGRVYRYVSSHEFIDDGDLRLYAERNDVSPDSLNAALEFLRAEGKLYAVADIPPAVAPESEQEPAAARPRRQKKA